MALLYLAFADGLGGPLLNSGPWREFATFIFLIIALVGFPGFYLALSVNAANALSEGWGLAFLFLLELLWNLVLAWIVAWLGVKFFPAKE